jgi:glyceraldehyde 3-phosphate dehydrogenase
MTTTSTTTTPRHNKTRCLLNGTGRIGRLVCRYAWEDDTLEIVALNDVCTIESAAYLLQYDSVHGKWGRTVTVVNETTLAVDGQPVAFTRSSTIAGLNLTNIDLVMECTGVFLKVKELQQYLEAPNSTVQQVVVSAPVKESGVLNVVLGCNHEKFLAAPNSYPIITNASCTTNCLAPIVKVMKENFGIVHGCITTIHVRICVGVCVRWRTDDA